MDARNNDTEVDVNVTVDVGVGNDRQPHAVEMSEHSKALRGGGAPPQFTGGRVGDVLIVEEVEHVFDIVEDMELFFDVVEDRELFIDVVEDMELFFDIVEDRELFTVDEEHELLLLDALRGARSRGICVGPHNRVVVVLDMR